MAWSTKAAVSTLTDRSWDAPDLAARRGGSVQLADWRSPRPVLPCLEAGDLVLREHTRPPRPSSSALYIQSEARQDIAFHRPESESGTRGSRIARISSNRGGGAHDHLDAMITGYPAQFCSTEFTANHLTSAIIDLSAAE
jgi:hypothetical protein